MQVFVPFPSPIDVARCLDERRLRKQIIECNQILKAIRGESEAWKNHPVTRMYQPYLMWLHYYTLCLEDYLAEDYFLAELDSKYSIEYRPPFLTQDFCDQHKRRLYTKAPNLYPQFAPYGTSDENWYVVDGKLLKYINGKQV